MPLVVLSNRHSIFFFFVSKCFVHEFAFVRDHCIADLLICMEYKDSISGLSCGAGVFLE